MMSVDNGLNMVGVIRHQQMITPTNAFLMSEKYDKQYLYLISHANLKSEKRKATKCASRELPY